MPDIKNSDIYKTVDHLFRQESGKMVSVLTRIFGFPNIEQAEDVVHDTILKALEVWKWGKIPDNPKAWLYKSAKNKAIDIIRREKLQYKIENEIALLLKSEYTLTPVVTEMFTEGEIKDSQLRMMFACCHPSITGESQITLILKTLCGLSIREISNAFLCSEDTINKRLYRTKEKIRQEKITMEYPGASAMPERIEAILKTLYLLFNEGYSSSHPEKLIREDLCEEAMRMTILLTENERTKYPQVYALMALMCYHTSRFNSRLDDRGFIILLKDQERSQWNKLLIEKGNYFMSLAAEGNLIHDFHIEASITAVHVNSTTFENTNWNLILSLYDILLKRTNNPIVALNRCLALAEVEGYPKAITELEKLKELTGNCHYNTSLGEMYFKAGDKKIASEFFNKAIELTSSKAEMELINRKVEQCI